MLASLAGVDQVEDRLPGGPGSVDPARIQAALDDASSLVRAEARRTWATVEDIADPADTDNVWRADVVVRVVLAVTLRALTNPDGITSEQVASYQVTYGGARSSDVYLTTAEKTQIRRAAGISGLWTQATTRGDLPDTRSTIVNGTEYLPTSDGSMIPFLPA